MSAEQEVAESFEELRQTYRHNAFLLMAMGLRLGTGDYDDLYRESVLDGPDDKKIDFFHIDWEAGCAIVAQGYQTTSKKVKAPPANKASDLNTAISWLLDSDLDAIPRPAVQAAAQQLREALESGAVHTVEVYYIHNLPPSANVNNELDTVKASLEGKLGRWAEKSGSPISPTVRQLGLADVVSLYEARHSSIRVNDDVVIGTRGRAQIVTGPNWRSAFATVPSSDIIALLDRYGDTLYSANLRDYLGERASARNINRKITQTALQAPDNFWVFNNGVTFITRRCDVRDDALLCSGLAVINGAQTLGSLQEASKRGSTRRVKLLVRVVSSTDGQLIQDIIRYNNTQNPIRPWELRVLDPVQERIERDFAHRLSITYQTRRGLGRRGAQDVVFDKLALWLNSFYGDPILSHRNSPEIFDSERIYRSLFNDTSDVRHLLFVYRLGEAIAATKDDYRAAVQRNQAGNTESALYGYFRYGAFTHVVLHLCSELLAELFKGGPNVKKRFILRDDLAQNRDLAVSTLKKVVGFALTPLPHELSEMDAYAQFRTSAGIDRLAARVRVTVGQIDAVKPEITEALKDGIGFL